jgi:hypothetical protein
MNKQQRNNSLRSIAIAVGGGIGLAIGTTGGLVVSIVLDDVSLWMFASPVVGLILGLGIGWIISNR